MPDLKSARREVREALFEYEQCLAQGEWSSYSTFFVRVAVSLEMRCRASRSE